MNNAVQTLPPDSGTPRKPKPSSIEDKIKSPTGRAFLEALQEEDKPFDRLFESGPTLLRGKRYNIMIVKLQRYSELFTKMSIEDFTSLQHAFRSIIGTAVAAHRGSIVRNVGYAYLLTFESPTEALKAALKIENAIARENQKQGRRVLDTRTILKTDEWVDTEHWDEVFLESIRLGSATQEKPEKAEKNGNGNGKPAVLAEASPPSQDSPSFYESNSGGAVLRQPGFPSLELNLNFLKRGWRFFENVLALGLTGLAFWMLARAGIWGQFRPALERVASLAAPLLSSEFGNTRLGRLTLPAMESPAPPPRVERPGGEELPVAGSPIPVEPLPAPQTVPPTVPAQMPATPDVSALRPTPASSIPEARPSVNLEEQDWSGFPPQQPGLALAREEGRSGPALRAAYVLNESQPWVQFRTIVSIPDLRDRVLHFWWKRAGDPAGNMEVRLMDEDGSNFGARLPSAPADWQEVRIPFSSFTHWWGGNATLDGVSQVYVAIRNAAAAQGTLFLDEVNVEGPAAPAPNSVRARPPFVDHGDLLDRWKVSGDEGTVKKLSWTDGAKDDGIMFFYEFRSGSEVQIYRSLRTDLSDKSVLKFYFRWTGYRNGYQVKLIAKDGTVFARKFDPPGPADRWGLVGFPLSEFKPLSGGAKPLDLGDVQGMSFSATKTTGGRGTCAVDEITFTASE